MQHSVLSYTFRYVSTGSEPTGRRKLLNRMPVLDMEAFDSQRTLLQENGKKNDKGETPKTEEKDGAEPGAEPEPGTCNPLCQTSVKYCTGI